MRPSAVVLESEQVALLTEDALATLAQVGVLLEHSEALDLARDAGWRTDGARVFFSEQTVRDALDTAPSSVTLFDRQGEASVVLGDEQVHFNPGSAALHLLDPQTGRRRAPTAQDCLHLGWVTQRCQHIEVQSTALIPTDVMADLADRYRLYLALLSCSKPVVTGTFCQDAFALMHQLLLSVRGSDAGLREKPLALFDCAPTPPLKWSELTTQALLDCARAGVPVQLVSMPIAGATAPVTLRDMVVQHCAENLAGLVLHQQVAPGAPVVFGGSPAVLDMRHGTTPMGAMETMLMDMANAQVGRALGLPTQAYMALSDAKAADYQAGMESGMGAVLAALAGVNMVSGPGMLDFEVCQSLEKLVLDNEACGLARRLVRGIALRKTESTVELLSSVVAAGHFLGSPHTRSHFRQELSFPGTTVERRTYGDWEQSGGATAWRAARSQVEDMVAQGDPGPLAADLAAALRKQMAAEAQRMGQSQLPY